GRAATKGDYVKIDLPVSFKPHQSDWVTVKDLQYELSENDSELLFLQLSPASSPIEKDESTQHFFDESSSSSFIVKREGKTLTISYYGRNEMINLASGDLTENL